MNILPLFKSASTYLTSVSSLRKESPLTMLMVFFATRGVIVLTCQVVFFILVRLAWIQSRTYLAHGTIKIFAAEPLTVGTANTIIMPKSARGNVFLVVTN